MKNISEKEMSQIEQEMFLSEVRSYVEPLTTNQLIEVIQHKIDSDIKKVKEKLRNEIKSSI